MRSEQRAGVTAQASDVTALWSGNADKASDKIEADSAEIETDSIGKEVTICKSSMQNPLNRMTTPKGNCAAGGTSIVESRVRRLSAVVPNEGDDVAFIRKVTNYHLLFVVGADPENGVLISGLAV